MNDDLHIRIAARELLIDALSWIDGDGDRPLTESDIRRLRRQLQSDQRKDEAELEKRP